jgi:hypothetical protein
VEDRPVEHDTRIPKSRKPIAVDEAGDGNPHSITPPVTPGGLALSDAEKAEASADSLEAQFQPVSAPTIPAAIEMVEVDL